MKIDFYLKENVNGVKYEVHITGNGERFEVRENNKKTTIYETRTAFLEDFSDLESWFWPEETDG